MIQDIKVGDTVQVNDPGKHYSTYDKWATKHGLTKWDEHGSVFMHTKYKVVAVGQHGDNASTIICGIEAFGKQHMVGMTGLTLINREAFLPKIFTFTHGHGEYKMTLLDGAVIGTDPHSIATTESARWSVKEVTEKINGCVWKFKENLNLTVEARVEAAQRIVDAGRNLTYAKDSLARLENSLSKAKENLEKAIKEFDTLTKGE